MARVRRHVPDGFAAKPGLNRVGHLPKDPMRGPGERSRENAREMVVPKGPRYKDRVVDDTRPDLNIRELMAPHGDEVATPVTSVRDRGALWGGPVGRNPDPAPKGVDDVLEGFVTNAPSKAIPRQEDGVATGAHRRTEMVAIVAPVVQAATRPVEERNRRFVLDGDTDRHKEGRGGVVQITVEVAPCQPQT